MNRYVVKEITPKSFFTKPVYIDSGFVLTTPELPFSAKLATTLAQWGFTEVYSDGKPGNADSSGEETVSVSGEAFNNRSAMTDIEKLREAEKIYNAFQKDVEIIFTQLETKNILDSQSIIDKVRTLCNFAQKNHRFLMRIQNDSEPLPKEKYLISHTVRSTIVAIIIGVYFKLPLQRLTELGVAAMLHEVGMIKIPSKIYLSDQPLTSLEEKVLATHPVLGYKLLNSSGFPLVINVAVLEHHERENGIGYPRQLKGGQISLYAKIIAVSSSYEKLSSNRFHKEAKDSHAGMLELLKNEGKQYDETVVRALVFSLSLYPIGLYVLLSSGKKGQVIDVNPENPSYPIVQIFGEVTEDQKNKTEQTSPRGLSIVRPLTLQEMNG
ncbi:MAG: HD-GYP domain-containing protein [Treponema sp.]|jgi:HD-GYP domain-containing protein (c-di-GMP phosphodiesterase class II)|nr:HD-GYP domain-containing protein [Treponema sp.]